MSSLVLPALLLALSGSLRAEEGAKFTSEPVDVKTTEHDTVLLPCSTDVVGERVVGWWKDELKVVDSSKSSEEWPAHMRLMQDDGLQVSDVTSADSGRYRCLVTWTDSSGSSKHLTQHHSLLVLYPPSLQTVPESGIVEVELHKEITIGCNPSGVPKPTVKWMHKGEEIKQVGSRNTLRFTGTQRSMEGDYMCVADNGVGEPAEATITLKFIYAPEVETPKQWIHTAPGLRTEITCIVHAHPPAKIEWLRNNKPLVSGSRIVLVNLGDKQMVIIRNTRGSDLAYYTCRATNNLGTSQTIIQVSGIASAPVFKRDFKNYSDKNYTLVWEVESYAPIIQHKLMFRNFSFGKKADNWTKLIVPADSYSPGPFHTQVYTLTGLSESEVYEAFVITRNKFGWSQPSQIIRFATGGITVPQDEEPMSTQQYTEDTIEQHILENNLQNFNGLTSRGTTLQKSLINIMYLTGIILFTPKYCT